MSGAAGSTRERISQAGEQRSSRIESLRALAALAVLVGHVQAVNLVVATGLTDASLGERLTYAGGLGVYFFFALTGYLLFWPFVKRDYADGGGVDLTRYAVNRALRILPLYFVVVIVVLALADDATFGAWWRFLTLSENFFRYTAGDFIGPAWSLVVELHFYLLLPLLAWAIARIASGARARAALVLGAIGLVSLALRVKFVYLPEPPSILWRLNIPTTFMFFVPGMLLALLRLSWEQRRPAWIRGALARADMWILASVPFWALVIYRFDFDVAICAAAFLTVGACVLPLHPGYLTRALEWRPLAVLGVASYSLYLWHVPVLETLLDLDLADTKFWGLFAVGVPASIVVALVSYRFIEAPFLRMRRQWSRSAAEQDTTPGDSAPAQSPA